MFLFFCIVIFIIHLWFYGVNVDVYGDVYRILRAFYTLEDFLKNTEKQIAGCCKSSHQKKSAASLPKTLGHKAL